MLDQVLKISYLSFDDLVSTTKRRKIPDASLQCLITLAAGSIKGNGSNYMMSKVVLNSFKYNSLEHANEAGLEAFKRAETL